jgi:hypothetical protein
MFCSDNASYLSRTILPGIPDSARKRSRETGRKVDLIALTVAAFAQRLMLIGCLSYFCISQGIQ